jgi:hypothetical protein
MSNSMRTAAAVPTPAVPPAIAAGTPTPGEVARTGMPVFARGSANSGGTEANPVLSCWGAPDSYCFADCAGEGATPRYWRQRRLSAPGYYIRSGSRSRWSGPSLHRRSPQATG